MLIATLSLVAIPLFGRRRVESSGVAIISPPPPPAFLSSFPAFKMLYTVVVGCPRVWKQDGTPLVGGLNMTRSIGDMQLKPEVLSESDVREAKDVRIGSYVVTATDGVWDELGAADIARIVKETEKKVQGEEATGLRLPRCEGVARIAALIVRTAAERGGSDNATVLVCRRASEQ